MHPQPSFGGLAAASATGMKRQMPSSETCARLALTVWTFVLSQFRVMPGGSTASPNGVGATKWGVTVRSAISSTPVQWNIAGWMFRRVAPAGTVNSTDFVTQSESAPGSGTFGGKQVHLGQGTSSHDTD